MILGTETWKEKREQAKDRLKQAKQQNEVEKCKAAAWEIEFWGRVSILSSRMQDYCYSDEWLVSQIQNTLFADEKYFVELAAKNREYSLIPKRIRELINDQC